MKSVYAGLVLVALVPFAACQDVPVAPDDDAGLPDDASVTDTSTPDTSAPDTSVADASDASVDSSPDVIGDASPDASLPVRSAMCGVLDPTAPMDGTFYDTTPIVVRDRSATTLLTAVGARDAWSLWDARTGQKLARGLGRLVNDNDTRATLRRDVLLVPSGASFETRDARSGALIHAFAAPGAPFRAHLSPDGSYVAVVTDAAITFATPQGATLRTVLVSSLPVSGVLPYGSASVAARDDGLWIAPSNGDTTVFVPKAAADAPRAIGPFSGGVDSFNGDGSLVIFSDFAAPAMATFRDVAGVARGAGLVLGTFESWGNYAWIVSGPTVTIYSLSGANATIVATYTKLGDSVERSSSGYLVVKEGVVSLRGPSPVLTPVAAYPSGATAPLAVDAVSGAWAMNAGAGGAVLGNALSFGTFGEIAGCKELRSVAATTSGKLLVAFEDHVEQFDAVAGRFDGRREIVTKSRIFASETGGVVVTDEPAAYDLATFTKTATFAADAVPLAVSHDGTRVALLLPASGQIEERNPRTGALLATHVSASTTRRARAIYSPDGTRLAVVRSVTEPTSAGAPVVVATDLFTTAGATTQVTHYPTYWESDALLATELLPSGAPNPPRWNAFEGTCAWSGVGAATCTTGASLGVRNGPSFSTYLRRSNGMLFQELPARVREIGGASAPWAVPDAPSSTVESRHATFVGKTFFWFDREGTALVPAGVRRHTF